MLDAETLSLLDRYEILRTPSVEEAQRVIGGVFSPHKLEVLDGPTTGPVRMLHAAVASVSLGIIEYGRAVKVATTFGYWHGLVLPLRGESHFRCGNEHFIARPGLAAMVSASQPVEMTMSADLLQFVVKFDQVAVERALVRALGTPLSQPVAFSLQMPTDDGGGRSIFRIAQLMVSELVDAQSVLGSALVSQQLEQLLISALIAGQPHNFSDRLSERDLPVAPRFVRRAETHILNHPDEDLTIEALCAVAAVSERTLFAGFKRYRGVTPMQFLRTVRLERVRLDLLRARPGETVTDIASRWGFYQFGRFAGIYRQRFGESPSTTLRQADAEEASRRPVR